MRYRTQDARRRAPAFAEASAGKAGLRAKNHNLELETWNLEPETWNLEPGTWNIKQLTSISYEQT